MIAAGCDAVDVVKDIDEMDRNNDNLITYEEFRYYVGVVKGKTNMVSVMNFSHSMSASD